MSDVASHPRYCFQNVGVDGEIAESSNMLDKSLRHFDRLSFRFFVDETGSIAVWPVAVLLRQRDVVVVISIG